MLDETKNKIRSMEVFVKGVEALTKLQYEESEAQNYLLDELHIADERIPELQLLEYSEMVAYIIDSAIKDVEMREDKLDFSTVYELAEQLDMGFDLTDEQRLDISQQFILGLRRLLKKKESQDLCSLTSSRNESIVLENVVNELDMHLLNSQQYMKAQCLLVDVLRSVELEKLTLGNYKRAYAECFNWKKDKEECNACYQRLVEKNPEDTNILYGWVMQKIFWKEYEPCLALIEKGLALSDQSYLDMYLDIAKECCKEIKDDSKYIAWKEQYKPQSVKKVGKKVNALPIDVALYVDAKPNKPCPCGSGKKFKSCCAKKIKN